MNKFSNRLKDNTYQKFLPAAAACLGHSIWGFSYLFTRIGLSVSEPDVLLSIRFLTAFLMMNLLILSGKARVSFRGKKLRPILMLAITEPLYFYFESYGILYTNATFSGVVLAASPVVSILLAIPLLKEYPSGRQMVFCILPIAGVILMTISGSSLGIIQPFGVFCLCCTCLTSSAYKLANRKSSEEFTSFERTYMVLFASALVFTISAFRTVHGDLRLYLEPLTHRSFRFAILMLTTFCSLGANMLVNYAAGRMTVVKLSTFGALTTLCSMFAGVLFLHEPMTGGLLLGAILILIGIRQVTREPKQQPVSVMKIMQQQS